MTIYFIIYSKVSNMNGELSNNQEKIIITKDRSVVYYVK